MKEEKISIDTDISYLTDAPFMERILFANRPVLLIIFAFVTLVLGYYMVQMKPEASFLRMIPTYHPYIENFIEHKESLRGLGNSIRISVMNKKGTIFSPEYLEVLKKINDEVFFISGVSRGALKSLWTPAVRWTEVTEDGFSSGPIIPSTYDGSPEAIDVVRQNVLKAGLIGELVANDLTSSIIFVPLHDIDPDTGKPLNYRLFSKKLEELRARFQNENTSIHITGFAKISGDLIEGSSRVLLFFLIAFFILLGILLYNSRCIKSTAMRAISSIVAVVWQLGIMRLCGYGLNPYSMLVPFLMFALGVSHGIQMFNSMIQEMIGGADKVKAARLAYRQNYIPGLAALITDCIGFASLMVIRIGVIQDIAIGASIGVAVVAFSDLMLLPVLMSYSGISKKTIELVSKRTSGTKHPIWSFLTLFSEHKYARLTIILAIILLVGGVYVRKDLKIGDFDPGAPELRPESRYNQDNLHMREKYSASSDLLVVMLKTPPLGNSKYAAVVSTDKLADQLERLEGVQSVKSHVGYVKRLNAAYNEGNLKWLAIPKGQQLLDNIVQRIPAEFMTMKGDLTPIIVYLDDHKAETLTRVVNAVDKFSKQHDTDTYQFLMAAGNAGIEAATNIEVKHALIILTLLVYVVVFMVCLISYRNFKAAICVVTPLVLTSVLCEALMAKMNIGIKVATLPVIAVGVGIGVDYGIYIYNKLVYYRDGLGYRLTPAYYKTLNTTGRAVAFTGITLSIGVATWAFSPIKFQADMGLLLTFMFLWNIVGAMVLLPALARLLWKEKALEPKLELEKKAVSLAVEHYNLMKTQRLKN